jgi:hypothetical protein
MTGLALPIFLLIGVACFFIGLIFKDFLRARANGFKEIGVT